MILKLHSRRRKPVYVVGAERCTWKFSEFQKSLHERGAVRPLTGKENVILITALLLLLFFFFFVIVNSDVNFYVGLFIYVSRWLRSGVTLLLTTMQKLQSV